MHLSFLWHFVCRAQKCEWITNRNSISLFGICILHARHTSGFSAPPLEFIPTSFIAPAPHFKREGGRKAIPNQKGEPTTRNLFWAASRKFLTNLAVLCCDVFCFIVKGGQAVISWGPQRPRMLREKLIQGVSGCYVTTFSVSANQHDK